MTRHHAAHQDPKVVWQGRTVHVRPLAAGDATLYSAFLAVLGNGRKDRSNRARLPSARDFALGMVDGRDVTIAAVVHDAAGPKVLGVARATRRADDDVADIDIVLPIELEGLGLGRLLLGMLIMCCRERGMRELFGSVPPTHRRMIELARAFRFVDAPSTMPGRLSLRLPLDAAREQP